MRNISIAIVGGGIGGLTAALSLIQAGQRVRISFDKDEETEAVHFNSQ